MGTTTSRVLMSMSMPHRGQRPKPRDYVAEGEWPHGKLRNDASPSAATAQELARRLTQAIKQNRSAREVADRAGLAPGTISKIVNGNCWCDIDTLARLETALDTELWGNEHRQQT